jgi:hypothetical protein
MWKVIGSASARQMKVVAALSATVRQTMGAQCPNVFHRPPWPDAPMQIRRTKRGDDDQNGRNDEKQA